MSKRVRKTGPAGVLLTLLVTLGFAWAGWQWMQRYEWPRPVTVEERLQNEQRTVEHLRSLIVAQNQYRAEDWDGDGQKTFAEYICHLHTSIDTNGHPMKPHLIPIDLAFAMGPSMALDGYYYRSLHKGARDEEGRYVEYILDTASRWAMLAIPAKWGETGSRLFMADYRGEIMTLDTLDIPIRYEAAHFSNAWKKVESF